MARGTENLLYTPEDYFLAGIRFSVLSPPKGILSPANFDLYPLINYCQQGKIISTFMSEKALETHGSV